MVSGVAIEVLSVNSVPKVDLMDRKIRRGHSPGFGDLRTLTEENRRHLSGSKDA